MRDIVLIIHDVRSSFNVGSMFRSADGLGVSKIYLTGYTPYPLAPKDQRLPHLSRKITDKINKTALGAVDSVDWERHEDISTAIKLLKKQKYTILALEQVKGASKLSEYCPDPKIAITVGNEIDGINKQTLSQVDNYIEIPMFGMKESFNVASAAAIALYQFRFIDHAPKK